jgi:predicted nuclease of predicted toxin-antitoxin system
VIDAVNRLYFDHDADGRCADALRRQGFDVVSAAQANLSAASDPVQLTYASQSGRVLVTHNIRHFPDIHTDWLANGRSHPGIITLIGYPPVGVWLRRMLNLFGSFSAAEISNQLVYLGAEFD